MFMLHAPCKLTSVAADIYIYKSVHPFSHLSFYPSALESHSVIFLLVLFFEREKMPILWEFKYLDH